MLVLPCVMVLWDVVCKSIDCKQTEDSRQDVEIRQRLGYLHFNLSQNSTTPYDLILRLVINITDPKATMPRPKNLHIPIPKPSIQITQAETETAIFQHDPTSPSKLQKEWEPGCQPDSVYDESLPPWRASLRRVLVRRLRREKDWMADWQKRVRTVGRDKYFYWTAVFGSE